MEKSPALSTLCLLAPSLIQAFPKLPLTHRPPCHGCPHLALPLSQWEHHVEQELFAEQTSIKGVFQGCLLPLSCA